MTRTLLLVLRVLAVAFVVYIVGALGGWAVGQDIGTTDSMPGRYLAIALIYSLGSALIGVMLPVGGTSLC